jgi:undecaprenyl-diphosphatase
MGTISKIDTEIVLWLSQWAGRFPLLDGVEKVLVSDYFIPACAALCLIALWFLGKDPDRRTAHQRSVLIALATVGFASLVVLIVNQHYFRPRPFIDHDLMILFYQPTDSSFPSHPATVGFSIASSVWQANKRMGAFLYVLAALWGTSRVFAGVCYPLDVAAGALIGIVMSYVVALGFRVIEPIPTLVLRGARALHLA